MEGSGDGRPPADLLQEAVDADVELGPRVRDRLFDRAPEDGGNLVALERRGELGSDRREHLRGVVARAEEDPVDERLEPGPERIEEEEHGEREEHGEGGRIGHRTRPEAEVEEHDRPDVRRADRTGEKEVVGAALHHRVDLEEVVLHDGVGEREQEEEDRHGGRVHGRAAARDRRGQHDQQGQAQAEEGAEGHHPDTLAGQRGAPAAIAPHQTHGGEHPDQPQVEHVQGQHVGVDRRPVEGPLVDREDRERDGIARQPPAGVAVRVGKEQRQLEERRGEERLADDVQPEEGRRAVEIHRGEEEESRGDARGTESARGQHVRAEQPDHQSGGDRHGTVQEKHAEEEDPVATGDALDTGMPEPVAHGGSRPAARDARIDLGRRGHLLPVHRHHLALVEARHRRSRPVCDPDRGDDAVVEEHEAREDPADPGEARDRRPAREDDRGESQKDRAEPDAARRTRARRKRLLHGRPCGGA